MIVNHCTILYIEEKLRALIVDLEDCLKGILGEGSRVYRFLHDLLDKASPAMKNSYTLMMILDSSLQALPWEAMQISQLFQGRVARDFSIHMMYHRIQPYLTIPNVMATDDSVNGITLSASTMKYIVDPLSEDQGIYLSMILSTQLTFYASTNHLYPTYLSICIYVSGLYHPYLYDSINIHLVISSYHLIIIDDRQQARRL